MEIKTPNQPQLKNPPVCRGSHTEVFVCCVTTFKGRLSSNLFICSKVKQFDKIQYHTIVFFNHTVSQEASNEVALISYNSFRLPMKRKMPWATPRRHLGAFTSS